MFYNDAQIVIICLGCVLCGNLWKLGNMCWESARQGICSDDIGDFIQSYCDTFQL